MASVSLAPRHLGRQCLLLIGRGKRSLCLPCCHCLQLLRRDGHGLNLLGHGRQGLLSRGSLSAADDNPRVLGRRGLRLLDRGGHGLRCASLASVDCVSWALVDTASASFCRGLRVLVPRLTRRRPSPAPPLVPRLSLRHSSPAPQTCSSPAPPLLAMFVPATLVDTASATPRPRQTAAPRPHWMRPIKATPCPSDTPPRCPGHAPPQRRRLWPRPSRPC